MNNYSVILEQDAEYINVILVFWGEWKQIEYYRMRDAISNKTISFTKN